MMVSRTDEAKIFVDMTAVEVSDLLGGPDDLDKFGKQKVIGNTLFRKKMLPGSSSVLTLMER